MSVACVMSSIVIFSTVEFLYPTADVQVRKQRKNTQFLPSAIRHDTTPRIVWLIVVEFTPKSYRQCRDMKQQLLIF
jgi:hypothetical protein